MREILFRGKRIDNGEWVEGYYAKAKHIISEKEMHIIFPLDLDLFSNSEFSSYEEVDPTTISQYTGLKDKNGRMIFEGDVVEQNWYDYDEPRDDSFGEVVFCEYDCSFSVMDANKDGIMPFGRCHAYHWEAEVIGNIHDNPELMKEDPQ